MLHVTAWTTIAVVLLLVILTLRVIQRRLAIRASLGDGGDPLLASAIRAHGNLAEHAPFALLLIGLLELAGAARVPLAGLATLFVAARIAHAVSLSGPAGPPSIWRTLGMAGTFLTLIGGALWLAVLAL